MDKLELIWGTVNKSYSCFKDSAAGGAIFVICGHSSLLDTAVNILRLVRSVDPDAEYSVEASINPEHANGYVTIYKKR
jgi:hypothetical protein